MCAIAVEVEKMRKDIINEPHFALPKADQKSKSSCFYQKSHSVKNDVGTVKAMATGRKCCHFTSTQ